MDETVGKVDLRAELARVARETVADEQAKSSWSYWPVRPEAMPTTQRTWFPGLVVKADCSKGVQFLCWFVPGVPDPMKSGWSAYGNSQTLWLVLQHLPSARDLLVGDFVTFGRDGEEHAVMVIEAPSPANGWDALVWSHGHPGAPNTYRLSQDRREQQYLRNPIPSYVPTPLDKAKARTGWFSWVAWKLGEGDYAAYGPSNPKARPNVPKRIPASWWTRYAKFLARRKRPNQAKPPAFQAA